LEAYSHAFVNLSETMSLASIQKSHLRCGSMNAGSALLVVFSVLAVSACEPPGPRPPVAVNHVHTTPEPSPSLATTTPVTPVPMQEQQPAAAAAAPPARCHTAGLLVS